MSEYTAINIILGTALRKRGLFIKLLWNVHWFANTVYSLELYTQNILCCNGRGLLKLTFYLKTKMLSRAARRNIRIFLFSNYQLNAHFLYSLTICMLHYNPQHVSSSTFLIFRRTNFIITASGIVTLCKQPYSMQVDSGLSPLSTCIL